MRRTILYIIIFALPVICFLAMTMNLGMNALERMMRKVEYRELKEYCHKQGLSESYAVVVDFGMP